MTGNKPSSAVAALEDTLHRIKTAVQRKSASDMHDQGGGTSGKKTTLDASTPAADDGDRPGPTGERTRENLGDVKDQQDLSHEKESGPADSPAFNDAGDETGSIEETDADAAGAKPHGDDKQHGTTTSHPARVDNAKIASVLKMAEEMEGGDYEEDEGGDYEEKPKAESEGGEGGGESEGGEPKNEAPPAAPEAPPEGGDAPPLAEGGPEGLPPEAMAPEGMPADPTMPAAGPSEEELAAIQAMLGGVPPKIAAAIPNLPEDEDGLKKVAADGGLDEYMEKCAQAFPGDTQAGFHFAQNLHQALLQQTNGHGKTAGDEVNEEVERIIKQAMGDAGNVAEIMAGMEEGEGEGVEGVEDPTVGGDAVPAEEVLPAEEPPEAGGAGEAEALLAALQQAGVGDEQLVKAASAKGFDADKARALLARIRKAA